MDYVRLFESGEYNPEEIKSKAAREFIKGIEYAEESIDNFFDDEDTDDDFSPTLGAIKKEITASVVESIKEWLKIQKCEAIVSILDAEAAAEDEGSGE